MPLILSGNVTMNSYTFRVGRGRMTAQGLSLGGPEEVSQVVLGCPMAGGSTAKMASPESLEKLITAQKVMPTDADKAFDILLPVLMPAEFVAQHPEIKQMMVAGAKMMPPTPPETADRAFAGIHAFNPYDRLGQLTSPVRIVHGDK